jgi:hypothetical protein
VVNQVIGAIQPIRGASWRMGQRNGQKKGVHFVHTLGCGLGRTSTGLARIRYVFGSSQYLQGLECGSSPTSGTTFSLVRGDFALTCVQSLRSRRLTGWFAACRLAAAVAYSGVWVAGFLALAGGHSACSLLALCGSSFRFCRVRRACPTPVHGFWVGERHDCAGSGGELHLSLVSPDARGDLAVALF